MLERTFLHLPGIGPAAERLIWDQGGHDWLAALDRPGEFKLPIVSDAELRSGVERSLKAREEGHHQFFVRGLGLREAWRAWPAFREKTVYLDIETDGGRSGDSITMIGLYDGTFRCLVQGDDLGQFVDVISHYSMVVSFYGSGFDLPMIEKKFRGFRFDQLHFDLCPSLRRVGIRGGLKNIEREMGIARGDETDGLTGWDAVKLWRRYRQFRDESALKTLVEYNREDVVNLERLAEIGYPLLEAQALGTA